MATATKFRKKSVADFWLATALAAASLFFVVYMWRNPVGVPTFGVSADTLPFAMSVLLLLLALLLVVEAAASYKRANSSGADREADAEGLAKFQRPVAMLALCIAYIAVLPWAGYLLASGALVGSTAWLFGNRRPVTLIGLIIIAPLALSIFFERAMVIYLPAGKLFE